MTELVEGLVQQFVHCTTGPFNVAILVGVAASSFWLFEICNFFGDMMLPTTRDQQDPFLVEISEVADLTMWKWVSGRARMPFGKAAAISGTAFLVASASNSRPDLRVELVSASFLAYSYILFTIVVLAPVARENPKDPGNDRELLLNKWIKRWIIRVLIPLVVFSLAMDILLSAFFE